MCIWNSVTSVCYSLINWNVFWSQAHCQCHLFCEAFPEFPSESYFHCLPDLGYTDITLWLLTPCVVVSGTWGCELESEPGIICQSQCEAKVWKCGGPHILGRKFFLFSAVSPSLSVLVFPIWCVTHPQARDTHRASADHQRTEQAGHSQPWLCLAHARGRGQQPSLDGGGEAGSWEPFPGRLWEAGLCMSWGSKLPAHLHCPVNLFLQN